MELHCICRYISQENTQIKKSLDDFDIWLSGSPSEVIRFVHSVAPSERAIYHHIDFPAIDGVPVEVHYRPCYIQNPLHNHRLQHFFRQHADGQFSHIVDMGGSAVAVPTSRFNAVYQLAHIYNHLFQEGIGLRQIIDYYFVICNLQGTIYSCSSLQRELRHLGLWRIAGAVMYVLHEVLGLTEDKMIVPMNMKRGKMLLDEILRAGNFGQYAKGHRWSKGRLGHNVQRLCRDARLALYYPGEALCEPIFRVRHFCWRLSVALSRK